MTRDRLVVLLTALLLAAPAEGDTGELVRRAQVRIEHGNEEGAVRLLRDAVAEDPSCAPALLLLGEVDRRGGTRARLQYLIQGNPLDLDCAAEALDELATRLTEVTDDACREVERAAMLPCDADAGFGPVEPWSPLPTAVPEMLPHGPLRWEAGQTPTQALRRLAREAASRLECDGIRDARLWGPLALLHRQLGDAEAAEAALARVAPADLSGRIALAYYAVRSAGDPCGWWRSHGDILLEEARGGTLSEKDRSRISYLWGAAARVLAEARDMPSILRLVQGGLPCLAAGAAHRALGETADALAGAWHADEACALLDAERDPAVVCLRGHLWLLMLQDDRAQAEFEGVLAADPDHLGALCGLWELYGRACRPRRQKRAGERILDFARRNGLPLDAGFQYERVNRISRGQMLDGGNEVLRGLLSEAPSVESLVGLISLWDLRAGPLPSKEFSEALERTGLPKRAWDRPQVVQALAKAHLRDGRGAEVLAWAERLGPAGAADVGRELAVIASKELLVEGTRDLLRAASEVATPSLSRDVLLRAMFAVGTQGVPMWVQRIRQDLEADPSFASLPAAPYVLSLLCDPLLERERVRSLRHAAHDRGCRAAGLLGGMARDGEDVLEELARVHSAEASLVRAIRSGDRRLLEAFLQDEDTMLPDQAAEAQFELQRLAGGAAPPTIAARWELHYSHQAEWPVRDRAQALLHLLEDPPRDAARRLPEAAKRLRIRLPWMVAEQARPTVPSEFSGRSPWFAMPRDSETEAILALWHRAERGVDAERFLTLVRAMAARHPLDLRWVAAERRAGQPNAEVLKRMCPKRSSNVAVLNDLIRTTARSPSARELLSELRALLADDSPIASWDAVSMVLDGARDDPGFIRTVLEGEAGRCETDQERAKVSGLANQHKLDDISARLDQDLWRSSAAELRADAVWRESTRRKGEAAGWFLEAASWPEWNGDRRRSLLGAALGAAAKGRDSDAALRAWRELWDGGLLVEMDDRHLRFDSAPVGPGRAYLAAVHAASDDRHPDAVREAAKSLAAAGYHRREWVALAMRGMGGRELRRDCRAALESPSPGLESWRARPIALALVEAMWMSGESEEAVKVADAWAERCGRVDVTAQPSPATWQELGLHARHLPPMPSRLVVPTAALAGGALAPMGERFSKAVRDVLRKRLDRARGESDSAVLFEALLLEEAQVTAESGAWPDLVPLLWAIRQTASTRDAWLWATDNLALRCREDVGTRALCKELLLEEWREVPADPHELRDLSSALADPDLGVREAASLRLRWRGPAAVPLLRELLRSGDPEVHARAEALLIDLAVPDQP